MSARTFGADNPANVATFRTGTGLTNAYPLVGPVVISEVMYHPPDTGTNDNVVEEFLELHNLSAQTVFLYDTNYPTNTWRLRDAVDFEFPATASLAPGGTLVVVSFDPATNLAALAQFQATYGTGAMLFGPYRGKLDNSDENVELYRPDAPETQPGPDFGFVPYILVDRVHYHDHAPWPTNADGWGTSLQRRSLTGYGNEPTNWTAAAPAPGTVGEGLQIAGQIELDCFIGSSRLVTFKATDTNGVVLQSWNLTLNFGGTSRAAYALTDVPPNTARLSAKTTWHLRRRLPVIFAGGQAVANFTGTDHLQGGDLNSSNAVDEADFLLLAVRWYTANPPADLDGNGRVDVDDYFILANNWNRGGDPE